jgi:murein DD-endopeptidase MepM/ murein hydrolase activator NlpD
MKTRSLIIFLLLALLALPVSAFGQKRSKHKHHRHHRKIAKQEVVAKTEEMPEADISDDYDGEGIIRMDTSSKYPCNHLYKFWANTAVDPYKIDLKNFSDTSTINLKGYQSPIIGNLNSDFGFRRRFHRFHYGVDLHLNTGDTVRAAFDGMVRIAKRGRGFGNYMVLRHYNKLETIYGHLSKFLIAPNQKVKAGDPIALGGSTGRSTGPHLHFELRYLGRPINPNEMVDFAQHQIKSDKYVVNKEVFNYLASAHSVSNGRFHSVRRGETLSHIAAKYKVSVASLYKMNHLKKHKLRPGQRIRIM